MGKRRMETSNCKCFKEYIGCISYKACHILIDLGYYQFHNKFLTQAFI